MADHSTLTSSACHEPKHISTATTTDSGKVITPSSAVNGVSELRVLTAGDIAESGRTKWAGWGFWADSTYTSVSPFTPPAATRMQIANDGLGSLTDTSQVPSASTDWWDTSTNKLVSDNANDMYLVTLHFHGETNTSSSYVEVELDFGGTSGERFTETKVFAKGTGTEHGFVCSWLVPANADFVTNGGKIYFTTQAGTVQDFWKFEISVAKIYSGA